MHSIEIFLCLIAIARIPHSESSDVMPHYVKSVDVTFPLLHEYKITVSGKWAFRFVFPRGPLHFTNADVVSVTYEINIDTIRICLQKGENELWVSSVIEPENDKVYFKHIQFIIKDEHGGDHYFDYAHTYTIEKKERSYSVKEESSYTYNRQGNSIDFEAQDVSVKVDKINEPLFKLKI